MDLTICRSHIEGALDSISSQAIRQPFIADVRIVPARRDGDSTTGNVHPQDRFFRQSEYKSTQRSTCTAQSNSSLAIVAACAPNLARRAASTVISVSDRRRSFAFGATRRPNSPSLVIEVTFSGVVTIGRP